MPYAVWAICKAVEQVGDTLLYLFRWRCATEPAQHLLGFCLFRNHFSIKELVDFFVE